MKNIFTCLLLFVFACVGRGQDYVPMLSSNPCWGIKYVDNISTPPVTEQSGFYHVLFNEVEIVSGIEYTKFYDNYDPVLQDIPVGFMREDVATQQVFYLNADEENTWLNCGGEEILLYDFSAEVGDTVYHCPNSDLYYVVQSITTLEEYTNPEIEFYGFGGGRVYEVYSSEFDFSTIYEGVGSNTGPIHKPYNVSTPGNDILADFTFSCSFILDTDDVSESNFEVFPNPVIDNLHIESEENLQLTEVRIYDLTGQILMTEKTVESSSLDVRTLAKGVYFVVGYRAQGEQIFYKKFVKAE